MGDDQTVHAGYEPSRGVRLRMVYISSLSRIGTWSIYAVFPELEMFMHNSSNTVAVGVFDRKHRTAVTTTIKLSANMWPDFLRMSCKVWPDGIIRKI